MNFSKYLELTHAESERMKGFRLNFPVRRVHVVIIGIVTQLRDNSQNSAAHELFRWPPTDC